MRRLLEILLTRLANRLSSLEDVKSRDLIRTFNLESKEELNIKFIGSKLPLLKIGAGTYINGVDLYCWDNNINISIGRYCSIADKVTIIAGGEHDKHWVSTYPFIPRWHLAELEKSQDPRYKGDIHIGNDVWIGNNTLILSGIHIEDGAVIGAGSVVTKDIPPYSIAAGNPAKVIRMRFAEEVIEELLKIKWWNWNKDKIKHSMPLFNNVSEFITQHREK